MPFSNLFLDDPRWAIEAARPTTPFDLMPFGPRMPRADHDELCQLAVDFDPQAEQPEWWVAQPKVDGLRAIWIGGPFGRLVSREGNLLTCGQHCVAGLRAIERQAGHPLMIDAELAHRDGAIETDRARKRGIPDRNLTLWAFDAMPLQSWLNGGSSVRLIDRLIALERVIWALDPHARPFVGMVHGIRLASDTDYMFEMLRDISGEVFDAQGEGVLLKHRDAPYVRRRANTWRKVKRHTRLGIAA